jgi:streptogrisin B
MMKKTILKLALPMLTAVVICLPLSFTDAEAAESKSALQYDKLMDSFEKTETDELIYPDYYGGAYINDNGNLVVCAVAENAKEQKAALKSIQEDVGSSDFEVKYVTYSYNALEEMMELLNEYKQNNPDSQITKNSFGHYLSDRDNTIVVELSDVNDEMISLFQKEVTDSPMITFVNSGGQGVNCATPNSERGINNNSLGISSSTGYRAMTNIVGAIGFVTAVLLALVGIVKGLEVNGIYDNKAFLINNALGITRY